MLGSEAEVEADEGEQEMNATQVFIKHSTGKFWIPVVDGAEDNKYGSSIDNVVKMTHNEVSIVHVDVEGNLGKGYACDAAKNEIHDEGASKKHRAVEGNLALPEGG